MARAGGASRHISQQAHPAARGFSQLHVRHQEDAVLIPTLQLALSLLLLTFYASAVPIVFTLGADPVQDYLGEDVGPCEGTLTNTNLTGFFCLDQDLGSTFGTRYTGTESAPLTQQEQEAAFLAALDLDLGPSVNGPVSYAIWEVMGTMASNAIVPAAAKYIELAEYAYAQKLICSSVLDQAIIFTPSDVTVQLFITAVPDDCGIGAPQEVIVYPALSAICFESSMTTSIAVGPMPSHMMREITWWRIKNPCTALTTNTVFSVILAMCSVKCMSLPPALQTLLQPGKLLSFAKVYKQTLFLTFITAGLAVAQTTQLPLKTWIDKDTGHRIVRLTDEPNSASLYFNQNGYTADRKKMVYTTPEGISVLNLETKEAKSVVKGRVRIIVTGRKSQNVYYTKGDAVFATDVDTLQTKEIAKLPPRGSIATVNADETLLAGTYIEGNGTDYNQAARQSPNAPAQTLEQPLSKGQMMEQRLAARLPMALFTINAKTGETKVIHRATDWLNHLEFSPTDPTLLMFCHEGPWHKVDRIWTMKTDGTNIRKIHTRTMAMEIFGHEFWSSDGSTIWYDLQTPRGEDFWLAGFNVKTGAKTWYHLQRNEWSIHFNVNDDATLFCGDGGDPGQVAKAPDGQWIYLFRPQLSPVKKDGTLDEPGFVHPGVFKAEKLVNMSKHNYRLEPNVSFSPDQKWVIFRSNMMGPTYAFAVEIEKAKQ